MRSHVPTRGNIRHRRSVDSINMDYVRKQRRDYEREPNRKGDMTKLVQLCACALIFLSALAVKTFLPEKALLIRETIVGSIEQGVDYREVFSAVGKAIGSGEGVSEAFKNIYGEFFEREKSKTEDTEPDAAGAAPGDNIDITENSGSVTNEISELPGEQTVAAPGLIDEEKEEIAEAARHVMSARNAALASRGFGMDGLYSMLPVLPQTMEADNAVNPDNGEASGDMPQVPEVVRMGYVQLDIEGTIPLKGEISSDFGFRDHPIDGEYKFHYGIDIVGAMGDTISSYADGEVYEVGYNNTYGNYVRVKHKNNVTSFYAHCSKIFVKNGQKVKQGERVAAVGQSGQVTGPHLHFEIRKDGKLIDPAYYIK